MKARKNLDTGHPVYFRKGFNGVVILKEWQTAPDGINYIGFVGLVSILKDEEILGFELRGNDSNWVARVDGATMAITVPGCQVRAVWAIDDLSRINQKEWMVLR